MHCRSMFTLLAVVLVACDVQAQRRRPRGEIYSWDLDLGDGTLIEQKAIVNSEANVTVVITRDPSLKENNLTSSVVLYDSIGIVAIKFLTRSRRNNRSPCFLSVSTSAYDDLVGSVIDRNGTEVILPLEDITLNGTGEPVSRSDAREIFQSVKSLRRFCRASRLIQTTLATGEPTDPDMKVKSILTLGGQENIIMPDTPTGPLPRPRPRPGNGGSRPRPRPRPGNGGSRPRPGNGGSRPRPGNGGSRPRPGNGGSRPRPGSQNDLLFPSF